MKFTIGLYGSFKDGPAGYSWRLPSGYDEAYFEKIQKNISNSPNDGRKLCEGELKGGYYIDVEKDLFYAFRFMDGGKDAYGRAGVVITNWAATRYSGILGRDLRLLFEQMTFKQLPTNGVLEIVLPGSNSFGGVSGVSWQGKEERLSDESAKSVLQLPFAMSHRNCLVEFTLGELQNEATVKFFSPAAKGPDSFIKTPKRPEQRQSRQNIVLRYFLIPIVCLLCFVTIHYYSNINKGNGRHDSGIKRERPIQNSSPKKTTRNESSPRKSSSDSANSLVQADVNLFPFYKLSGDMRLQIEDNHGVWCDENKGSEASGQNLYQWGTILLSAHKCNLVINKNVIWDMKGEKGTFSLSPSRPIGEIEIKRNQWTIRWQKNDSDKIDMLGRFVLENKQTGRLMVRLEIQETSVKITWLGK